MSQATGQKHALGELPDKSYVGDGNGYAYTDGDMYAYALAEVRHAVAAERERCMRAAEDAYIAGHGAKGCIAAIRALDGPTPQPTKE